jgi:3-dehydroquinate dehydratase type I
MEKTTGDAVKSIRHLEQHDPDFIEIRLDSMKRPCSFSRIRDATSRRLVAANRSKADGGLFRGAEETRLETLVRAAQEGFDYIDLELRMEDITGNVRRIKKAGAKSIVSYHNLKRTPPLTTLESILALEKRAKADVCKIVCAARSSGDNLRCLRLVEKHAMKTRLVCFCMGRIGIPSRILSPALGGYFTFASARAGRETARGQIPIRDLRALYKELALA